MRHFAISVVILSFVASLEASAFSYVCSDRDLSPSEQIRNRLSQADAVFIGTVVSAKYPPPVESEPPDIPASSGIVEGTRILAEHYSRHSEQMFQRVSLSPVKYWKGERRERINAKIYPGRGSGVASSLDEGATYLVFAYRIEEDLFSISLLCGGTTKVEKAHEKIKILDELTKEE